MDIHHRFQYSFSSMKVSSHTYKTKLSQNGLYWHCLQSPIICLFYSPAFGFRWNISVFLKLYVLSNTVVVPMQMCLLKTGAYCIMGYFMYSFKLNSSVFTLKWSKTAATSLILEISPLRCALVNSWISWHSKSWYLPGEGKGITTKTHQAT